MKAKPELVVVRAGKPSASRTRAEPASHGFGITNGSPACSSAKRAPSSACVGIGSNLATRTAAHAASGSVITNVAPPPGVGDASAVPPCASVTAATIERPSPTPPLARARELSAR